MRNKKVYPGFEERVATLPRWKRALLFFTPAKTVVQEITGLGRYCWKYKRMGGVLYLLSEERLPDAPVETTMAELWDRAGRLGGIDL